MKVTAHGAAGDVTGSAYLLETQQARVLIDFGMFQGGARIEAKNVLPSGLDPTRLDAVLLTHAHLDHCGRLPLLHRAGYHGAIHATEATRDLAGLILRDSAKVQASDLTRTNRKRERAGKAPAAALYGPEDIDPTLALFRTIPYAAPTPVADGITVRFLEAGHMLGSASIEVSVEEQGHSRIVVFSGDLGPIGLALVRDSVPHQRADLVFLESTYGERDHKPLQETLAEFLAIMKQAVRARAKILVPAFAVGRTQQIIYHLNEMFCAGTLEPFPIYLDSPMAIEASKIYLRHPDLFDDESKELDRACDIARQHQQVRTSATAQESMALNEIPGPCLIMAGSGMCNAGRILHHLRHNLWHPETVVMIVGFQSEGTLGRQLVDGAKTVRIFGEPVAVKAQIKTLNGFSAHAGQTDLLKWFRPLARTKPIVALTHGEARGREGLAAALARVHRIKAILPAQGDIVRL